MAPIGIIIANKPKEEEICITIMNTAAAAIATVTNITTVIAMTKTTAAAVTASTPLWRSWWL